MTITLLRSAFILPLLTVCSPGQLKRPCTPNAMPPCGVRPCTPKALSPCGVHIVPITEVPSGTIDGFNRVFALSSEPVNPLDVRVSVNSRPLGPREVSAYGKRLQFESATTPRPGDAINVSYYAIDPHDQPGKRSDTLGLFSPPRLPTSSEMQQTSSENYQVAVPASQAEAVLRRTILQSIEQEQSSYRGPDIRQAVSPPATVPDTHGSPSLNLIARSIEANNAYYTEANERKHQGVVPKRRGSESTGDLPVLSPYDVLLGLSSSREPFERLVDVDTRGVSPPKGSSLALRMLKQRLDNPEGDAADSERARRR